MNRTSLFLCSIALVAAAVVPKALAGNRTFPGLNCVQDNQDGFSAVYYGGGTIRNDHSTNNAHFRCAMHGLNTVNFSSFVVTVDDQSTTEGVSCYIRSCEPDGTCTNSSTDSSTAAGEGIVVLSDFGTVTSYTEGTAHVYCTLPDVEGSMSGIWSYMYNES